MSLRALRSHAGFLLPLFLLMILAGCGTTNHVCPLSSGSCCGPAVLCVAPQYLFATTQSGQVLSFPVNRSTGALGTPTTTAGPAISLGFASLANFAVYASDSQNDAIAAYSINFGTGALTPIAGSPFSLGNIVGEPTGLAIVPANFLYTANINGSVNGFSIAPDGSLSQVSTSPFPAGDTPAAIVFGQSPQGQTGANFLYVANSSSALGSVSGYTIDTASGALTPVPGSPVFTGANTRPFGLVYNSFNNTGNGPYLYVGLNQSNRIAAFSVDRTTGALTPVPGSPFSGVNAPVGLAQFQSFLFVGNQGDQTISAFSVNPADGSLTPVTGSPFAVGTEGSSLAVSGLVLYAVQAGGNGIIALSINSSTAGGLAPISGSPFAAPGTPVLLSAGP
jgi:6-phosphogluconolactonase